MDRTSSLAGQGTVGWKPDLPTTRSRRYSGLLPAWQRSGTLHNVSTNQSGSRRQHRVGRRSGRLGAQKILFYIELLSRGDSRSAEAGPEVGGWAPPLFAHPL